ncbi:MAG: PEP-CTERM sorting domain-containing protein [Akkermansia sp.]|nr:PEP-CTERM sorting domain-containing protein [Akkermansia sp.]
MKKTIITLLALSGLAMGVETLKELDSNELTVGTLQVGNSNTITGGNAGLTFSVGGKTQLSAYIITFGYDEIPSDSKDSWLRLENTTGCGIGTTNSTTMDLRTGVFVGNSIAGTSFAINTEDTFALTFSVDTVYLSNLSKGTYISTTVSADDVAGWKLISGTARIWTHSGTTDIQVGQVADLSDLTEAQVLSVVKTGTVPEPATATLSLLALAGLAARRRRA